MRTQVRVLLAVAAAWILGIAIVRGRTEPLAGVVIGVIGLAGVAAYGAWALRRGRHTPWAQAQEEIGPGRAVVLWKPGCVYCERMLKQIGDDPRVTWVNVWHDDEARARVRELNHGDELTPTVQIGDLVLRNPPPRQVLELISSGRG